MVFTSSNFVRLSCVCHLSNFVLLSLVTLTSRQFKNNNSVILSTFLLLSRFSLSTPSPFNLHILHNLQTLVRILHSERRTNFRSLTFCTTHLIYRTDGPLLPTVVFLYIQSKNIFNYFFRVSLTIFVYSSTKCRVFPNVTLLGS